MQLIGRIYAPDVAILPIGDHFTMGPREAAVAAELIGARRVVASHYATFPLLTGTPEALRELLPTGVELLAPAPGETSSCDAAATLVRRNRTPGARARAGGLPRRHGRARPGRRRDVAALREAHAAGRRSSSRPARSRRSRRPSPAPRSRACSSRTPPSSTSTSPTSPMAERRASSSRRTRSAPATSTRASGVWRRSRSSWPSARSCRGRHRTSARSRPSPTRTPATGRTGSSCSAPGHGGSEVVERLTAADEGRDAAPARHRRRGRPGRDLHRRRVPRLGRRARRRPLRRAGQHPRLRRDGRRARRHVPRLARHAARRAAARLPRRRAGRRRRPPRPAVGRAARRRAGRRLRLALRHPRRPPRRRPPAADRGAGAPLRAPPAALREDAGGEWIEIDDALRAEIDERLAASATPRSRTGPGREPRGAGRRRGPDRPGRPPGVAGRRLSGRSATRSEAALRPDGPAPTSPGSRRSPARSAKARGDGVVLRAGDENHGRVLGPGERGDEQLEPDGERERLVGELAPEGHELAPAARDLR